MIKLINILNEYLGYLLPDHNRWWYHLINNSIIYDKHFNNKISLLINLELILPIKKYGILKQQLDRKIERLLPYYIEYLTDLYLLFTNNK